MPDSRPSLPSTLSERKSVPDAEIRVSVEGRSNPFAGLLSPGDFVAARLGRRVHVCRIERLLGDTQLEVVKFEIPHGQRYGPWTRRPWRATIGHAGEAGKEVIPTADVLIHVELSDEALTVRSLERLAAAGLDLTGVPHLEASLPRPLAGQ